MKKKIDNKLFGPHRLWLSSCTFFYYRYLIISICSFVAASVPGAAGRDGQALHDGWDERQSLLPDEHR